MLGISGVHPYVLWGGFLALVFFFLWLDLAVFHKKVHSITIKEALIWFGVWFGVALIFNVGIWLQFGAEAGLQFFTGYLIEKSLSVDNLFVMLMIFAAFGIESKHQHRVLLWGILGVLILRGLLILVGSALISRFEWLFFLFGLFLVWTGLKMFFEKEEDKFDHEKSMVIRFVRKFVRVSKQPHRGYFFTKENGKFAVTILLVALVSIELTDVVFASDSIPAIFAITTDPFLIFTSNVFAILGLRSLYFVIAKAHETFRYLKYGIAVILVLVGAKLFFKHWYDVPVLVSLIVIVIVLAAAIGISLFIGKHHRKRL